MSTLVNPPSWGAKPGQTSRPWTLTEQLRLHALVQRGVPDGKIAKEFNRTPRAVAIKRHKMGLTVRTFEGRSGVKRYSDDSLVRELRRRGYTVSAPPYVEVGS